MNSRIGIALLIVAAIALGWMLKMQTDVSREQMNEIRNLRAKLGDNGPQAKSAAEVFRLRSACADMGQRT
jgi:hypothetical protein